MNVSMLWKAWRAREYSLIKVSGRAATGVPGSAAVVAPSRRQFGQALIGVAAGQVQAQVRVGARRARFPAPCSRPEWPRAMGMSA
jgi:hypothetical protein